MNVNDTVLMQAFKKRYPSVVSGKVVTDPLTRKSKGYGFVKFSNYEESQKALKEMNLQCILAKPIKVR